MYQYNSLMYQAIPLKKKGLILRIEEKFCEKMKDMFVVKTFYSSH